MKTEALDSILHAISDQTVKAYKNMGDQLLLEVNHWISGVTERERFLNGNAIELLLNNHKNHHGFITQVMTTKDTKAIVQALPWVYHAYHAQGIPFSYFVAELNKWKEVIENSFNSDYANEVLPLYDWMLEVHDEIIEASKVLDNVDTLDPEHPFLKAITLGDHRSAYKYAQKRVITWDDFEEFFMTVAQPAMYEVGILWEKGKISVAAEHLATAITNRVLSGLLFTIDLPEPTKSPIVVTCATSEYHQIGPWMVSVALEADGWDVDYLGVDTPPTAMIDMIRERGHKVVLISVTMPYNITPAQELVALIKKECPDIRVIVGGQAFSYLNHPESIMGADKVINSYAEAVDICNEWY